MRLFLDDWVGRAETFELSADIASTLLARRFVMISAPVESDPPARVIHASDPTLAAALSGRLLREAIGPAAAGCLMVWAGATPSPEEEELTGIGALPGSDDMRVVTAHRVKVFLQVETVGRGRVLHITFQDIRAKAEGRENPPFAGGDRQEPGAATRVIAALEERPGATAAERGAAGSIRADVRYRLRNHLNGILPVCEWLVRRGLGPPDQAMIELMNRSTQAIYEMLDEDPCLDGSADGDRWRGGETGPASTPGTAVFSLKAIVDAVEQLSTAEAAGRFLAFRRMGDSLSHVRVRGDALGLRQILTQVLAEVIATSVAGCVILDISRVHSEVPDPLVYRFTVGEAPIPWGQARVLHLTGPGRPNPARKREVRLAATLALVASMGGRMQFHPGAERQIVIDLPFVAMTLGSIKADTTAARKPSWRFR